MVRRPRTDRRRDRRDHRGRARSSPASTSAGPRPPRWPRSPIPHRGTFFHRMGDLGYRDDRGRLWFCGRKSHRVMIGKTTLYTICCEGVFNAHPDVARTALVGVDGPSGTMPVLCVEPVKRLSRRRAGTRPRRTARARGGVRPYQDDHVDPVPPVVPGRHPAQLQDLPREAGGLGREEAAMTVDHEAPVLVTGGGGFWARRSSGCFASAAARPLAGAQPLSASSTRSGVEQIQGDVADPAVVSAAVEGCETVFHVAAKAGLWGPYSEYHRTNVVGTRERDRGLPDARGPATDLHQLAQRRLHRARPGRRRRVDPLRRALRRGLSRDQGDGREAGAGEQRREPGHGLAPPAPDLGPGRQQHPAADLSPGREPGGSTGSASGTP